MRTYKVYRNIRIGALIWGLPISLFALLIISVVVSMLIIIFSFSTFMVIGLLLWNAGLYTGLIRIKSVLRLVQLQRVFPTSISNKKVNPISYVQD